MGDKTAIEWTDTTVRVCSRCRASKPLTDFPNDRSRASGRGYECRSCKSTRQRAEYTPRARPAVGRSYVAARDGDRSQARRRVHHLVDVGVLPPPNALPCADCGHVVGVDDTRHEYDHHLGYAAEHHEDVEPVCAPCHRSRQVARRAH